MTRRKVGPPSAPADDAVARLGERWRDACKHLDEARLAALEQPGAEADRRINALLGENVALEHLLVRTPAAGLTGIEAKLRVALTLLRDASARDSVHARLLASALRDLRKRLGR